MIVDCGWTLQLPNVSTFLHLKYWHERSAFQSVNWHDVSSHYFHHFPPFHSPSQPFLIDGVLGSENLFSKS